MKKYTSDYFKKKYTVLLDRLTQKEGFIDDIKQTREELGMPTDGFNNTQELAGFFIKKLKKEEQRSLTFFAFLDAYAFKNKIVITEKNREEDY
ncbi:MAG TPA: hypothetical protein QGH92_03180 [Candidatus Parcubacteria bacterium]|jgi:hypothetical protein|nr:hypothetical protein [Candidatus Parcubacteria bacterium]